MQRRLVAALTIASTAVAAVAFDPGTAPGAPGGRSSGHSTDAQQAGAGADGDRVLVELADEPLTTSSRTRPGRGSRIDFSSDTVRAERARLAARRNEFRSWLRQRAPRAQITGEFDLALNAVAVKLNGTSPDTLAQGPGVRSVAAQGLYRPSGHDDPDLGIIRAAEAWDRAGSAGAGAGAGAGVKVAVLDTGIDAGHPCFRPAPGTPDPTPNDPFTNAKVIVAKVFANKTVKERFTPEAVDSHGTHVAGTVACNLHTPAVVDGADIPYDISGVAPAALLGNYNVFPGTQSSARSEDILNALEAAYQDGMDVANLSLGGPAQGKLDLLTRAIDNLDLANMVVVVAAGNSGPGRGTVESPGSAARALTAGASTVPHFVGTSVVSASGATVARAAAGDFAVVEDPAGLTGQLHLVPAAASQSGLSTACQSLPAGSLEGDVAVVSRGGCTFSSKIRNAQVAGAAAVLVVNNVAGDPVSMGADGTPDQPTVPAYMVGRGDLASLSAADGSAVTIPSTLGYFATGNGDIMAGFSSQGPTDVDRRVKPDVVAPGVNVLSAVPANACDEPPCFAFFQGTSMATPHLAGSAAVVRAQHPQWSAAEVRSAIVNTAVRGVLRDYQGAQTIPLDVNVTGAGRQDLTNAVGAAVALDPVSVSFGTVPAGSAQVLTRTVTVTALTAGTYGLGSTAPGVSVSPTTVRLGAGESATITLTFSSPRRAPAGERQGWLDITDGDGAPVAHAAVYALVK
ncbi:MAG: S8 family serine peptidase [Actinobacteria bacterium]|nr:S8 family serine peptidase [Actinomycetota bacterium]